MSKNKVCVGFFALSVHETCRVKQNAALLRIECAADVILADNNFDLQRRKPIALVLSCAPISHRDSVKHADYLKVCLLV